MSTATTIVGVMGLAAGALLLWAVVRLVNRGWRPTKWFWGAVVLVVVGYPLSMGRCFSLEPKDFCRIWSSRLRRRPTFHSFRWSKGRARCRFSKDICASGSDLNLRFFTTATRPSCEPEGSEQESLPRHATRAPASMNIEAAAPSGRETRPISLD